MIGLNRVLIASAGAGKTSRIVKDALSVDRSSRVLITTFTRNNVAEITSKIQNEVGIVPANITVMPWFTFILRELVRPYQNYFYRPERTRSLAYVSGRSDRYAPKTDKGRYFFNKGGDVYSDKISELALSCNHASSGRVLARLEERFGHVFIDEVQDFAGYDLDILKLFLSARFSVDLIGDYRQAILSTNQSPKYKKYRASGILILFESWWAQGICTLSYETTSHRCVSSVCAFSDLVFPDAPKTSSTNIRQTGHDGVYVVSTKHLHKYVERYAPQILRHSKANRCEGLPAMNFGISKGLTFQRCLIFPTSKIKKYLVSGNPSDLSDRELFYVSVTRARQSVAFVHDGDVGIPDVRRFVPT